MTGCSAAGIYCAFIGHLLRMLSHLLDGCYAGAVISYSGHLLYAQHSSFIGHLSYTSGAC